VRGEEITRVVRGEEITRVVRGEESGSVASSRAREAGRTCNSTIKGRGRQNRGTESEGATADVRTCRFSTTPSMVDWKICGVVADEKEMVLARVSDGFCFASTWQGRCNPEEGARPIQTTRLGSAAAHTAAVAARLGCGQARGV
jgi:hypothetical protein